MVEKRKKTSSRKINLKNGEIEDANELDEIHLTANCSNEETKETASDS